MATRALVTSAAIEVIICTPALQHGSVSPTLNYEEPYPACGLEVVPNRPLENCSLRQRALLYRRDFLIGLVRIALIGRGLRTLSREWAALHVEFLGYV
jgi:hypothetical protein